MFEIRSRLCLLLMRRSKKKKKIHTSESVHPFLFHENFLWSGQIDLLNKLSVKLAFSLRFGCFHITLTLSL